MSGQQGNRTTTTEINVPVHIVWEYLSDLERWDEWNPCVRFSHGDVDAFFAAHEERRGGEGEGGDDGASSTSGIPRGNKCKAKLARYDAKENGTAGSKRQKTWLLVGCTIDRVSRQDLVVSWTTYRGLLKNTTVMQLLPSGNKRTLLKHTQTLQGPKLAAKLLGMNKHGRSLLTQSVCVDQSLKNHVECQYFQTLLTDLSTSLPHRYMAKYLCNAPPSPTSSSSGKGTLKVAFAPGHHCDASSSTMTMRTEQCSSDFWQTPESLRKAVISRFVEEEDVVEYDEQ
jgi:hypothetical protein